MPTPAIFFDVGKDIAGLEQIDGQSSREKSESMCDGGRRVLLRGCRQRVPVMGKINPSGPRHDGDLRCEHTHRVCQIDRPRFPSPEGRSLTSGGVQTARPHPVADRVELRAEDPGLSPEPWSYGHRRSETRLHATTRGGEVADPRPGNKCQPSRSAAAGSNYSAAGVLTRGLDRSAPRRPSGVDRAPTAPAASYPARAR